MIAAKLSKNSIHTTTFQMNNKTKTNFLNEKKNDNHMNKQMQIKI